MAGQLVQRHVWHWLRDQKRNRNQRRRKIATLDGNAAASAVAPRSAKGRERRTDRVVPRKGVRGRWIGKGKADDADA